MIIMITPFAAFLLMSWASKKLAKTDPETAAFADKFTKAGMKDTFGKN